MYRISLFFLLALFSKASVLSADNIITVEKKVKIHRFKHTKVVLFKIDSTAFYFDASHLMSEVGVGKGIHLYHQPIIKDLILLLGQKDTVDLSKHRNRSLILSLVNEGLKKGYVDIYFSNKLYPDHVIQSIEYWDIGVKSSPNKDSNLYRPESDVFMDHEGNIFYYFKPSLKRPTEQRFRD